MYSRGSSHIIYLKMFVSYVIDPDKYPLYACLDAPVISVFL